MRAEQEPEPNGARASRSGSVTRARRRRTSEEVERLILESARRLFSEKGFWGTSTREIAETAGVAEVLLFRHFGSKADLYSASVVLPMTEFITQWLDDDWSKWDTSKIDEKEYEFNARLYQIVASNRGLIMSYLAMSVFEPDLIRGLEHTSLLRQTIDRLADRCSEQLSRMGTSGVNVPIGTRAGLAMVLAMALLHDLNDPLKDPVFKREDVIEEMTQLILHGSLHRPGSSPSSASTPRAKTRATRSGDAPKRTRGRRAS